MLSNPHITLISALAVVLAATGLCPAQSQPQLQINSPADGTIVNPGQTISVAVTSPAGATFTGVALLGEGNLGISDPATAVPAQLSITIPSGLACRRYMLKAKGRTAAGDSVDSATIDLDVERPDMPVSLSNQFAALIFEAQGQQAGPMLLATFADGSILEVSESTKVTYQSSNTTVATVDATGTATAVAAGTGSIVVTYNNSNGPNLQLAIPVTVLPPALTPVPRSLAFGTDSAVYVGTSASAQIKLTNTTASDELLSVKGVAATGDYSETDNCVSSSPLVVGATCTITVTFAPTAAGTRTGTINIANSSSVVPTVIPLTGIAAAAPSNPHAVK